MNIDSLKKLYFLGIGGIGMSAIARYFLNEGVEIYGYDLAKTSLTKKLEAEGMHIHYDIDPDKIPKDIDGVIMTPAIPKDHRELAWINENNYSIKKRAEVLGLLSQLKKTIAVAGTHGKTTTSSLIAHILKYCGLDITAFLGGILVEQESNFISGHSDIVVLEADEYDRSFLHLHPDILVVLSMDPDHLDIYGTVEKMYEAYEQLCLQIKPGGHLIMHEHLLENLSNDFLDKLSAHDVSFIKVDDDFSYENLKIKQERFVFDFQSGELDATDIISNLPGSYNVSNSAIAIQVALMLDVDLPKIKEALRHFRGIKRRFEWVYEGDKILIDDYAHHPEELKQALTAVNKLYPDKKILGVFQPHLYSRTQDFYKGFAKELARLSKVFLMPIYPARELPIEGVRSEIIFNLIPIDDKYLVDQHTLIDMIRQHEDIDVIMTIGAADLDKYHEQIINVIK